MPGGAEFPRPREYAELPADPAEACPGVEVDVTRRTFDDGGRRITVHVAFGEEAPEAIRSNMLSVLNHLQVTPTG